MHLLVGIILSFLLALPWSGQAKAQCLGQSGFCSPNINPNPSLVFAWYIAAFPAYGNSVAGYKTEILQAQAAGIDGFGLDMYCWIPGDTCSYGGLDYRTVAANMFEAAKELGTNFKLFLITDCDGAGSNCTGQAGNMLTLYAGHPNYYYYSGQPVLGAFSNQPNGSNGSADNTYYSAVIASANSAGFTPYFIPSFQLGNFVAGNDATTIANYTTGYTGGWIKTLTQGICSFTGLIPTLAIQRQNDEQTVVQTNNNETYIAAVSGWYAGLRFLYLNQAATNDEFNGGEGMAAIWANIRSKHPSLVILVAWNDYTESYMNPATQADLITADTDPGTWQISSDYLWGHIGYTELNKYFVQWYKGGSPPTWPDSMYVFYRPGAQSLVPSIGTSSVNWNSQGNATLDDIYVTTILTAPATLEVNTGGNVTDTAVAAGVVHTRIPFTVGTTQTFKIIRSAVTLISITGAAIPSSETHYYNVNSLTYYGHNP